MDNAHTAPASALIPRRLAALFYDLWVSIALWMLLSTAVTAMWSLSGHAARENIAPFSLWQWLLWGGCWLISGAYAVISWHRGGQTLGMRAWKIAVVDTAGNNAPLSALRWRYVCATASTLAFGAGFWWAWLDRDKLTWHDRLSRTRLVRLR